MHIQEVIKSDLRMIEQFFATLHMKLNRTKTTIAKFGTRQQLAKLRQTTMEISENISVEIFDNVRSLGLMYDRKMIFNFHFEKLAKFFSILLYNRTIRSYMEPNIAILLVE